MCRSLPGAPCDGRAQATTLDATSSSEGEARKVHRGKCGAHRLRALSAHMARARVRPEGIIALTLPKPHLSNSEVHCGTEEVGPDSIHAATDWPTAPSCERRSEPTQTAPIPSATRMSTTSPELPRWCGSRSGQIGMTGAGGPHRIRRPCPGGTIKTSRLSPRLQSVRDETGGGQPALGAFQRMLGIPSGECKLNASPPRFGWASSPW